MFPSAAGSYVVHFWLERAVEIGVGRLGVLLFPAGHYYYCGSAHGPGGLAARLSRHGRAEKRLHWHIDYFSAVAQLQDVHYRIEEPGARGLECWISARLARLPGARHPAPGFGARDCRAGCVAHLVCFSEAVNWDAAGFEGFTEVNCLSGRP